MQERVVRSAQAVVLILLFMTAFLAAAADLSAPATPQMTAVDVAALSLPQPLIALIIDDMGNQRWLGERVIDLDGPVACAIMPHTGHATYLAERAHAAGKEVMLHLPMQPMEMQRIAGPGEISLDNDQADLARILDEDLRSVPHSIGVNNHMGSLITRHPGHMRWLMEALAERGDLFFVDSFTTKASVAYALALETGVPAARRHVFLDNDATEAAIEFQFERLKRRASRHGYAIGIAHPYPATLNYLQTALPLLEQQGYTLVPISQLVELLSASVLQPELLREDVSGELIVSQTRLPD